MKTELIRLDKGKIGEDGIYRARGRFARIGVQTYLDGNEYRSEEVVRDSAAQFASIPITIDHKDGLVDETNKDENIVGYVLNGEYVDGWVVGEIVVHKQDAIDLISKTHKYFSAGYKATTSDSDGVWVDTFGVQGQKGKEYHFDKTQDALIMNHVTITDKPRAGKMATILDSSKDVLEKDEVANIINEDTFNPTKQKPMVQIKHNGMSFDIEGNDADKIATIIEGFQAEAAAIAPLEAELVEAKAANELLQAKHDSLNEEVKVLSEKAEAKLDSDVVEQRVQAELASRIAVWAVAQPVLKLDSADYSMDSLTVKREAIKALRVSDESKARVDSYSEATINELWLDVPEMLARQDSAQSAQVKAEVTNAARTDSKEDVQSAFKAAQAAYLNKRCS